MRTWGLGPGPSEFPVVSHLCTHQGNSAVGCCWDYKRMGFLWVPGRDRNGCICCMDPQML